MIRICEICGKPIYSWDAYVANESGMACHSDCFKGLTYNFTMGNINLPRKSTGKITGFDKAFYILMTAKGDKR